MHKVSLSIVTFKTTTSDLNRVYESIKHTKLDWQLYLIDNSPTNELSNFAVNDNRVKYLFNNANIGFGAGHNIAIELAQLQNIQFHFIVNPDIYFTDDVISLMVDYMQRGERIGMIMPQILNEDGSIQHLPKLLPSPLSILWRKIKKPVSSYQKFINEYELRSVPKNVIYNAPVLSGCFTLLNLDAIKKIGLYDENYFMYFEDWDLSRRMHQAYKTIYFPLVSVYHGYDSGANKSSKLFKIFIKSAVTYFNKWGWFFDTERKEINKSTLAQFK